MSDQEQQLPEMTVSSENQAIKSNDEKELSDVTEKSKENESNSSEQHSTRRVTMPQDVRYSTEPNDRQKLMEKYDNYQVSDTNACNIRFLTDTRQKKNLFGRNEEENFNLQTLGKTFNVNIFPGYQQPTRHSYKIFGTEANVNKCLLEIMDRMYKRSNRSTQRDHKNTPTVEKSPDTEGLKEKKLDDEPTQSTSINPDSSVTEQTKSDTSAVNDNEKHPEIEGSAGNEKSPPHPTTIDPDSLIMEEKKPITPDINEEKTDDHHDNNEQEQLKFIPLERKRQFTFIMLITSQGQEVLKKNWTFFAGSLQQRLNIVVTNPVKLPKFGDKQVHNELSITGESIENLTDATLQIAAFINDVLGVPIQPYNKPDEDLTSNDNNRSQPSSFNNQQGRTFFNRNRNGAFEQIILIRSDCVARIIGTRGSTLKRIQAKCHLHDMIVARQANENGYVECTLSAYQTRNLHFAINTIRGFLRNEDESAILVIESNHGDGSLQNSPHPHELIPPNSEHSSSSEARSFNEETGFLTKPLTFGNTNSYPQPSYIFQNTPSFDFTHQATSASRKTDKRRGEIHDHNKTPTDNPTIQYENFPSSNSPRHKSKRSCPETKEIDCTTDDGFWIQKQYYHALDDTSKQLFDSLIEKLDKIRIATEENAARKQQRLVGRNRANKTRVNTSSIAYLNENNNQDEKDLNVKSTETENNVKVDQSNDSNDEKENKQETSAVVVNEN